MSASSLPITHPLLLTAHLVLFVQSPPPLCDFIQWLDNDQNDSQKLWVDMNMRWRREAYARREYEQQQEELRLKREEEERMRKAAHDHTVAQAREAERARKRERARRAKAAGPDALRKGKYPRCTQ